METDNGDLLSEWAEWMRAGSMSARTINDRLALVKRFEAQFECESLTVDWKPLSTFLATPTFSAGTRQTYHANLSAWFGWLQLMDHRLDDPTRKLRSPKAPRRNPRPITVDQLGRLLSTRMHARTRVMVLLGAYEGLRVSEIARIRGSDLRGGQLRVLGKGGRLDYLPVHQIVEAAAATMPRSGYWFPSHTKLGPVAPKSVSTMLCDAMRRAGIPATAHALRHFFATECLRLNGNLALTQQLMRHENIATTTLYAQVDDAERRATLLALPVPIHRAA